jgi:hypothetical protein
MAAGGSEGKDEEKEKKDKEEEEEEEDMVLPPVDEALLASLVPKIANKSYGTETTVSEMHIRKALMAGRRSDNDVRDWITMKLGAFDPSAADPTINDPIPKVVN